MVDNVCFCVGFLGPEIYWTGYLNRYSESYSLDFEFDSRSALLNHHGRWMLMAFICWVVIVVQGMKRFKALMGYSTHCLGIQGHTTWVSIDGNRTNRNINCFE